MPEPPRPVDWALLGLEPNANLSEVEEAYLRRRRLYDWGSLATYEMLSDEERRDTLARLEEAHRRIVGVRSTEDLVALETAARGEPVASAETEHVPDRRHHPGSHLRYWRLARGLTLADVAKETKIRAAIVEQLENEDFRHLPADVYVRGFVALYGRLLGLDDPPTLAAHFLAKRK